MIGIRLFWFGKPRNRSPEDDLVRRYTERLQPWAKFEQIVLKPLNIQSESADKARMLEAQRFLERWDGKDFLVILDERGQQMTSPQMATFFDQQLSDGQARFSFLIGGSYGVDSNLRQRANQLLSLSKMTFPHGLARVLLVEQLYRSLAIRHNHPYHHEE